MPKNNFHKIILASKNEGKIAEFYHLLNKNKDSVNGDEFGENNSETSRNWEIVSLRDFPQMPDVDETGTTFVENALLKAREIAHFAHLPAISDDSGLSIDFLDGRPGVFSARYAGGHGDSEANMAKVLVELEGVPGEKRGAHFTCVVAFVVPSEIVKTFSESVHREISHLIQPNGDLEVTCEGILRGRIGFEKRGEFGFGYDPIFIPLGGDRTLAQYTPEEKKRISHRSVAMSAMDGEIKRIFPVSP